MRDQGGFAYHQSAATERCRAPVNRRSSRVLQRRPITRPDPVPPFCSRWDSRAILGRKASLQGVEHPPPRNPGSEAPQHPFCMWRWDAARPSHRSLPDPRRAPAAGSPQTWQGPFPNSPLRLDCPLQKAAGSGDPLQGEDPQKGSSFSPKPWEFAASL